MAAHGVQGLPVAVAALAVALLSPILLLTPRAATHATWGA